MMTNTEFIRRLRDAADNHKTLYVMGCFGAPMTEANKKRYTESYDYNRQPSRAAMIAAASADTFGFDCVCLIKGVLWGWCGDASAVYGGAAYTSNGVPDIDTESIIGRCAGVSTDFKNIAPGELLWMEGHVGVYVGGGIAVECSPAWGNGVQYTAVGNMGGVAGYNTRTWKKHGKLPYVEYVSAESPAPSPAVPSASKKVTVSVPELSKGNISSAVSALQSLLNMRAKAGLDVDGDFGTKTDAAVRAYQRASGLAVDGICGVNTWTALLE